MWQWRTQGPTQFSSRFVTRPSDSCRTERIINQRVEHSSLRSENFHMTQLSHDVLTNKSYAAHRLFFISLRITFAREQNGDRGAGTGGSTDKRRVRSVYWEQRKGVHHLCRSNSWQRDHHVHASDHQGAATHSRPNGAFDDCSRCKS